MQLGGPEFGVRPPRVEKKRNDRWGSDPTPDPTKTQQYLISEQRPTCPEGRAGALIAARDYELKEYSDDAEAPRWHIDALANAIGWRIIEATLNDGAEAGIGLIDDVAREMFRYSSNNELFAVIGEGLAVRCDGTSDALKTVASYCLTLAYIRIRGGGGWRAFAGRERTDLWTTAHDLDPLTAERTLATALAGTVETDAQRSYGVTQAVVAAFAAKPTEAPGGTAVDGWDAAFTVIQERLPGTAERNGHTYRPTASSGTQQDLDIAMATLALATISQPLHADLRQTLLANGLAIHLPSRRRTSRTPPNAAIGSGRGPNHMAARRRTRLPPGRRAERRDDGRVDPARHD